MEDEPLVMFCCSTVSDWMSCDILALRPLFLDGAVGMAVTGPLKRSALAAGLAWTRAERRRDMIGFL